ncbi:MAG TPA: hypothetical protein VJI69_00790, partial [Bacteroidia bacterium]|nr:hypothetical protein [Bacteroidia bacterium]
MKKILPIIFITAFSFGLKSQNIYDPYVDFNVTPMPPYLSQMVSGSGFNGEYQLFVRFTGDDAHHWSNLANANPAETPSKPYSLFHKVEVVSFPFAPVYIPTTTSRT